MSKIHYFQRYSTLENTVTNNTLQLIARIYQYSPTKASQLLSTLADESIEIGIEITQQRKDGNSIPDATIIQRSFKVLIESKVDSGVDKSQLIRHASSFRNEEKQVLLLLTKQKLGENKESTLSKDINFKHPSVIFKNVTYEEICLATDDLFQEYEYEMVDLVADYKEYCNDAHLFDQAKNLLRIVPCGKSLNINLKYGIYFQPTDRGYSNHRFLGIYAQKKVQAIWEIDSVFDAEFSSGKLSKSLVSGRKTNEYDKKIIDVINEAKKECGYNMTSGLRFFCGTVHYTNFVKTSSGGIMGARLINLKKHISTIDTAENIALQLGKASWK